MKKLPFCPFLAFRTIVESVSCTESMERLGEQIHPRNQRNHKVTRNLDLRLWSEMVQYNPCQARNTPHMHLQKLRGSLRAHRSFRRLWRFPRYLFRSDRSVHEWPNTRSNRMRQSTCLILLTVSNDFSSARYSGW